MNNKVYKTLEFTRIKEQISHKALSPMAKERILALEPFDSLYQVNNALNETSDGTSLLSKFGTIPLRGLKDLRNILQRLRIQGTLSISELLEISDVLNAVSNVTHYYRNYHEHIDGLSIRRHFDTLDSLEHLSKEIHRCILSEDEIADHASAALASVRRTIQQESGRIKSQLNKIVHSASQSGLLQDNTYTIRNDRYCVPLKAEYRSQFKGMIHDQSSTGSTLFVEPLALVELNNKINTLLIEEKKEIQKILQRLSQEAGLYVDVLDEDIVQLTNLDFVMAKAEYSMEHFCARPTFNEDGIIYLEKARHPLLDPATVVPTTIYLGDAFSTLVITGPNTGGKTVTLKTLGLLSLMGQSGLHIPAFDNARLSLLDNIFADIGDEQSIEQSLSTFSAHMTNITHILDEVTEKSLVLFDELGAGTDPTEGAALAMAILDFLRERRILTMATTHYSELKVYALSTDSVENASCEFDVNTLRPTYRLLIGVPGKSNAFAISKRLGLSDTIIDEAKQLLSGREVRFEDLISDLEANKKYAVIEKERAEQYRREAEQLKKEVDASRRRLSHQKKQLLDEAKQEAYKVLDKAKEEADGIIRNMNRMVKKGTGLNMAELEAERSRLRDQMKKQEKRSQTSPKNKSVNVEDLKLGSTVFVTTLNQKGTLIDISPQKKEATVQLGIMKSKVPFSSIDLADDQVYTEAPKGRGKKYRPAKGNGQSKTSVTKVSNVRPEIDLRGTTISEALEIVDKYLDNAYLSHLQQVTLIHGKGTGALRQGLHNFLRKSPHVASFRLGEFGEGDSGVTIVTFKE